MMKKIAKLSLAEKVAIFFLLVIAFGGVGIYVSVTSVQQKELLNSSRQLARFAEAVLSAAETWHGVWVEKAGNIRTLKKVKAVSDEGQEIELLRLHDPEALGFISSLSSGKEIKVTFTLGRAVQEERWSLSKGKFEYEAPLRLRAGCISCHSKTSGAPTIKLGASVGTIKVVFANQNLWSLLGWPVFLGGVAAFLLVAFFLYGLVRFELLNPLLDLTQKVREMSLGNLEVDLGVRGLTEEEVRDEILKLAISIERLRKSQKAMEKMLDEDSLNL